MNREKEENGGIEGVREQQHPIIKIEKQKMLFYQTSWGKLTSGALRKKVTVARVPGTKNFGTCLPPTILSE